MPASWSVWTMRCAYFRSKRTASSVSSLEPSVRGMRVALPYLDAFGAAHRVERLRASEGALRAGGMQGKTGAG